MKYIDELDVWEEIPRPKHEKVIGGRWVDINKGDEANPTYRSRYVGKELKKAGKGSSINEFFAAMPPMSNFKALLALAQAKRYPDEQGTLRRAARNRVCLLGHQACPFLEHRDAQVAH